MAIRVYYLDDEQAILDMFCDAFSSPEIQIIVFTDPNKAIQAAKANPPDVIFLDYRLPGTTGDEVALKLDEKIPKVLLSGDIRTPTNAKYIMKFEKPYKMSEVGKFLDQLATKK